MSVDKPGPANAHQAPETAAGVRVCVPVRVGSAVTRSHWTALAVGGLSLALSLLLLALASVRFDSWRENIATAMLLLGPASANLAWAARGLRNAGRSAEATVDERGIHLDGRLHRASSRITSVQWEPVSGEHARARVRITSRLPLGTLAVSTLECESEDDARALVEGLRFAPAQRAGSFSFVGLPGNGWLALVAAIFGVMVAAPVLFRPDLPASGSFAMRTLIGFLAWLAPALVTGLLANLVGRRILVKVEVGLDGIRLRHRGRDRFVPFEALPSMPSKGRVMTFEPRGEAKERWYSHVGFDAFRLRIEDARRLSAAQAADSPAPAVELLNAAPTAGYRGPAYPKDLLLRVLEDATQATTSRAAAADALRAPLDDEERARVRIAAATSASPELRQQLEELAASAEAEEEAPARARHAP